MQVGSGGSGAGGEADAEELEKMRAQLAETEQLMEMVRDTSCLSHLDMTPEPPFADSVLVLVQYL